MRETPRTVKAACVSARARRALVAAVVLLTLASPAAAANEYEYPPASGADGADAPVLSLPTHIGEVRYTPGRGLRVGDTGLTLGGYGALDLTRDDGGPATFTFEDLSLFFIWDPTKRLHLFSELDVVEQDEPSVAVRAHFWAIETLNLKLTRRTNRSDQVAELEPDVGHREAKDGNDCCVD